MQKKKWGLMGLKVWGRQKSSEKKYSKLAHELKNFKIESGQMLE